MATATCVAAISGGAVTYVHVNNAGTAQHNLRWWRSGAAGMARTLRVAYVTPRHNKSVYRSSGNWVFASEVGYIQRWDEIIFTGAMLKRNIHGTMQNRPIMGKTGISVH